MGSEHAFAFWELFGQLTPSLGTTGYLLHVGCYSL
jgi:hypothetical protein